MYKAGMNTTTNIRIAWIDIAKAIGMLLVIHNHFNLDYGNNELKIVIASFHMPLFFILTGLTLKASDSFLMLRTYLIKRFAGIMLPFFLWSVIFINKNPKSLIYILYGSNPSIGRAGGIGGSWFFPCFFASCVIVAIITLMLQRNGNQLFLRVAAVGCFASSYMLSLIRPEIGFPLSFDVSLSGAGFILLGMIFRQSKFFDKITDLKTASKLFFCIGCLAICVAFALLNIPSYNNDYHRPVMALAYYGIFPMFIITGIVGSMAIMLLGMIIEEKSSKKIIAKIGAQTFTILMLQQMMIDAIEKYIQEFSICLLPVYPLLLSIVILIVGYLLAVVISTVYPNLAGKHMIKEFIDGSDKKQK